MVAAGWRHPWGSGAKLLQSYALLLEASCTSRLTAVAVNSARIIAQMRLTGTHLKATNLTAVSLSE